MNPNEADVTALLEAWDRGDREALERLMEVVGKELHEIADRLFRKERPDHTLQPTAVVNEAYLKLKSQRRVGWENRTQFFAGAAEVMRRILVDHARERRSLKRGGGTVRVPLNEAIGFPEQLAPDVVALDDALKELARRSPRQSRIVELRVFVGLTLREIAVVEGISSTTVAREWRTAKMFLYRQLRD